MTSNACTLLCLVLSLIFVTQSIGSFVTQSMDLNRYGECHLNDLYLKQSKTGKLVQNKPEWEVTLTNPCYCRVHNIKLLCAGFKSVTLPGPGLAPFQDLCLLRSGEFYLNARSDLTFTYVWDTSYNFKIVDAEFVCPY